MPTEEMAVATLANQIQDLASGGWSKSPQARYDLIAKAEKLIMAAREPGEELRLAGSVVSVRAQFHTTVLTIRPSMRAFVVP